jgi:uncharacterized cupin superfamily protein
MLKVKLIAAGAVLIISAALHGQTVTSITPDTAGQGESLTVAITGQDTYFAQGSATVWLSNGDSVIFAQGSPTAFWQGSSTINDTLLTVDFDIPEAAAAGNWDVNVETDIDGILTLSDAFTVVSTTPTLISIVPVNTQQDQSLSVTISGQDTHFEQGSTSVWLSNGSMDIFSQGSLTIFDQGSPTTFCQGSSTVGSTLLSAQFDIPADAQVGSWDVYVETAVDGILGLLNGLTIEEFTGAVPAITSVSPDTAKQGDYLGVAITGQDTYFTQGGATVWLSKGDSVIFAQASPTAFSQGSPTAFWQGSPTINDTLLAVHFDIPEDAQVGNWDLNVETDLDGVFTLVEGFAISQRTPVLTSVAPSSGEQNQYLSVAISGQDTDFSQGSVSVWLSHGDSVILSQGTPTIFGQGSPTSFCQGSSTIGSTLMGASFDIPEDAKIGCWDVNVETAADGVLTLLDGFIISGPPNSLAVRYDGDTLLSADGNGVVEAVLVASVRDEYGNITDAYTQEVTFTLTSEGIEPIVITADAIGGIAQVTQLLEPATYLVEVNLNCSEGIRTTGVLVISSSDGGGYATGGGWIVPVDDGLNTYPGVRANFGFNAKLQKGKATGHVEFRYTDGYIDLKSTSIENIVVTGRKIVQFKGWASVNNEADHWFYVKAIDNGKSGINDVFEIKVWNPGISIDGDPSERAVGVLEGGNIQVHTKKK